MFVLHIIVGEIIVKSPYDYLHTYIYIYIYIYNYCLNVTQIEAVAVAVHPGINNRDAELFVRPWDSA